MKDVDLRELALKKVKITGNVIGKFGSFEIEQKYQNNTKEVLEVGYTFPIVETATVVGFEIRVGDKVLKGKCKEKEAAKEEYQRNMVQGNSAYLMEQETDNIFKVSVGKIDKGEEVTVIIRFIDKFEIVDNSIQVLLPTLVTPKYRSYITNRLFYRKVDYTIDFNININKAINRKSIYCPSHNINLIDEKDSERVEVLDYDLSKDFKLVIELKNELASNAITSKTLDKKDMIYLSFMPEITETYEDEEKEYIFIVDVSGSMSGQKIEETKRAVIECLKQLDEGDKFNIIPFESNFEAMSINSIDYNEQNLQKAIEYVNNLKPLGGTEILKPLIFALYEKDEAKTILLFTDGQVGNEKQIIDFVDLNIKNSRIFPFGIDTNVNSSFIKHLAKIGNGKAELIQPHEKIDDKIIRTFARIQSPLVEDLEIDYGKNKLIDEIREEKCLFNYEFFNVFAEVEKLEDDIILKGKIQNKEHTWKIKKENIKTTNVDVEVLFAKQQMDRLEEYIRNTFEPDKIKNYEKMIVELSEKYNINSKYTSFITIYERENKILDVPTYQNTPLSNAFEDGAVADSDIAFSKIAPSGLGRMGNFVKKSAIMPQRAFADVPNEIKDFEEIPKTDKQRLVELVDEYFATFMVQKEKSLKTYLLYAILYCFRISNPEFDYSELINYLSNHRDEILSDELYSKLLFIFNKFAKDETHQVEEFMNQDYKKASRTGLNIKIEWNELSPEEKSKIVNNNSIAENIDKAIETVLSELPKIDTSVRL